jgi:(+)-abscisic acid 8'-hydroxylase
LEAQYREEMKRNYRIVDKGYNSFATSLPGTPYRKAVLVSKTNKSTFDIRFCSILSH